MSHDFYAFCIDQMNRAHARVTRLPGGGIECHEARVAALVWWSLRNIADEEIGSFDDPCTDTGYRELCEYWAYKLEPIAAAR